MPLNITWRVRCCAPHRPSLRSNPFELAISQYLIAFLIAFLFGNGVAPTRLLAQDNPAPDPTPSTPTPHQWLSSAPGEVIRLIDRGNVEIIVDDEKLNAVKKEAVTLFRFSSTYQYQFRYQYLDPEGVPTKPPYRVRLIAIVSNPEFELNHTLVFRSRFNPKDPWTSSLVRHEFDHVSISTDPRLLKLMKKVWTRRMSWIETFDQPNPPNDEDFNQAIKAQIETQTREFERLIQAHYDLLDQESKDGNANLTDRTAFFKSLYSLDSLKKRKFLYLDSVRAIMQDGFDKDVSEHYLILDSP